MPTILHIGADKTGTTAIQAALATNREYLEAAGVIYPNIDQRPDHRALLKNPALLPQVESDTTLVLSFEGFWPAGPEQLAPLLRQLHPPLAVVGWARAPEHYVDAAFRQRCREVRSVRQLRSLLRLAHLPAALNPIARRCVRRYEQIQPWQEAMGPSLRVFDYEPVKADIVTAFFETLELPSLDHAAERKNASPSLTALLALAMGRETGKISNPHDFLAAATAAGATSQGALIPERTQRWCWDQTAPFRAATGVAHEPNPIPLGSGELDPSAARALLHQLGVK